MNKSICYSHIGKRLSHEDNFLINSIYLTSDIQKQMPDTQCYFVSESILSKVCLFAVSDGMGGHNAGEVSSRICIERLAEAEKELQWYSSIKEMVAYLQTVIIEINNTICKLSCKYSELKGMGTTLVLLVIYGMECAVLNIGDSRAYYFHNNSLIQITKDHTEGQRMLDLGILSRKELSGFPARKNLNRYIGYGQNGYVLQADEYYFSLETDILVLCSDGISDFISNSRILEILSSESSLERTGRRLIDEAIAADNADNATVMLIQFRR